MDIIITDIQILAMLICAALSFIAYKVRIPTIAVIIITPVLVGRFGFFILGFEIYTASEDLLILGLFFMLAVVQFVICFGAANGRR